MTTSMTPEDRIASALSPRLLLAAIDGNDEQLLALMAEHRPIDLIAALGTTAYSLAVEVYGSKEKARAVFAGMALAADVDQVLAEPLEEWGAECAAEVAELEAEQAWDAADELHQYGDPDWYGELS